MPPTATTPSRAACRLGSCCSARCAPMPCSPAPPPPHQVGRACVATRCRSRGSLAKSDDSVPWQTCETKPHVYGPHDGDALQDAVRAVVSAPAACSLRAHRSAVETTKGSVPVPRLLLAPMPPSKVRVHRRDLRREVGASRFSFRDAKQLLGFADSPGRARPTPSCAWRPFVGILLPPSCSGSPRARARKPPRRPSLGAPLVHPQARPVLRRHPARRTPGLSSG